MSHAVMTLHIQAMLKLYAAGTIKKRQCTSYLQVIGAKRPHLLPAGVTSNRDASLRIRDNVRSTCDYSPNVTVLQVPAMHACTIS